MGRYLGPSCKVCRRTGTKLFLKGDRCLAEKCGLEKRKYPPGQRPRKMRKVSGYGLQLKEKQKLRKMYGLLEKQFRRYFDIAARKKGKTGDNLLVLLETRFDSVIYNAKFGSSRQQARQLIKHRHFTINEKKVDIPSYNLKEGDVITVSEKSRKLYPILKSMAAIENSVIPSWMQINQDNFEIKVLRLPERADIEVPVQEQTIVELYSK